MGERAADELVTDLFVRRILGAPECSEALGKIGDARAVEPLIGLLSHRDWQVRWGAADALGEIGDARAVEPLIAALADSGVGERAADALVKLGNTRAVEPLIAALGYGDVWMRSFAVRALRDLTTREAGAKPPTRLTPALVRALTDSERYVRETAAASLLRFDLGSAIAERALAEAITQAKHERKEAERRRREWEGCLERQGQ